LTLNINWQEIKSLAFFSKESIKILHQYELLIPLIKETIIDRQIQNYTIDETIKNKLVENFCKEKNITSETQLKEFISKKNISFELFKDKLARNLKQKKFALENFGAKAEARFLQRKEGLDIVKYNLIRVKEFFLAREIYTQIKENESTFELLAQKFGEGPEKDASGLIGPIPINRAHPQLAKLLRTSKPQELREPILVNGWHLIVQLEEFIPATFNEQVKQMMITELYDGWLNKESGEISSDMIEHYQTDVNISSEE
tara:strand:+ start:36 stop:809 length:774 start_codon:yes stop_codon:yes gene_type:complete